MRLEMRAHIDAGLAGAAELAACAPCQAAAPCAVLAPVQRRQSPAGPSCQHGRSPGPTDHTHIIQWEATLNEKGASTS